ncbi:hypothetical protein H6F44_09025 [Pseudanabaena sp. FACHB-1277]|uniref:Uncharacterized protein n=2 Tax=Pseudanabaena TaxID=1152 RepID=A0A926Z630_9CYAN|nr:hypothetical protein [Pseudanabaena cinerea FACHB-1277]
MRRRCDKNRKRSKRREIKCPIHDCYMDSVSQKHRLFANQAIHLQQRGVSRIAASMLITTHTTVSMQGEWLEAFWCEECQQKNWYYVQQTDNGKYSISLAPRELWQRVTGVIDANGNPSVGEFTRKNARQASSNLLQRFYDN